MVPIITFLIPLEIIRSAHGGVLPVWEQGSRLTYKDEDPRRFLFLTEFIALTSAWGPPALR
jgi:hypothetical protein